MEAAGKGEAFIEAAAKEYAERAVADTEAFAAMAPAEVKQEWEKFVSTFADKYKLSAEEKAKLDGKLDDKERAQLVAARQFSETADAKKRKELQEKAGPGDLTVTALAAYARWAVGVEPRASKLKFVSSGDAPLTAPQRREYIDHRQAEVSELEKRAADKLGVGHGIEMTKLRR